jgi:hypothetical protein
MDEPDAVVTEIARAAGVDVSLLYLWRRQLAATREAPVFAPLMVAFDASESPWKSRPLYSKNRAPDTLARAERAIDELGNGEPFLIVYYGSDGSGGWQGRQFVLCRSTQASLHER